MMGEITACNYYPMKQQRMLSNDVTGVRWIIIKLPNVEKTRIDTRIYSFESPSQLNQYFAVTFALLFALYQILSCGHATLVNARARSILQRLSEPGPVRANRAFSFIEHWAALAKAKCRRQFKHCMTFPISWVALENGFSINYYY